MKIKPTKELLAVGAFLAASTGASAITCNSGHATGWLDAARVWSVMYAEFLKPAAPDTSLKEESNG